LWFCDSTGLQRLCRKPQWSRKTHIHWKSCWKIKASLHMSRASLSPSPHRVCVCFFALCNRHWFNRVPGSNLGIACLPITLTLTLAVPTYPQPYWMPQSASGRPGSRSLGCRQRDPEGRPPGTGPHVPVRRNRGSNAIHSSRSPWRIGLNPT
jgi:hypothetical protein